MALPAQQSQKPRRDSTEGCLLVFALSMLGLRSPLSASVRPYPNSVGMKARPLALGLVAQNARIALGLGDRPAASEAVAIRNVRLTCAPCKGGTFQWVRAPPGNRSSRQQPEQSWRQQNG